MPDVSRAKQRFGKGLVGLGAFGNAITQWIIVLIIAWISGAPAVGLYASMLAFATPLFIAGAFALRDISLSFNKNLPWTAYLALRACGIVLSMALFALVAMSLSWPWETFLALSLLKCADSVADLYYGKIQLAERWVLLGGLQLSNAIFSVGVAALVALAGGTMAMVVGATALVSVVLATIAILSSTDNRIRETNSADSGHVFIAMKSLTKVGAPLLSAQLLSAVLLNLPIYVLQLLGNESEVGVFAVAAYIITFGNLFGSTVATIEITRFRTAFRLGKNKALRIATIRPVLLILFLGSLLSLIAIVFGQKLLVIFYGAEFLVRIEILALICLTAVVGALGYIASTSLLVLNSYTSQVWISASAVIISMTFAGLLAWVDISSPMLIASITALGGALARTALLWWRAKRHLFPRPKQV